MIATADQALPLTGGRDGAGVRVHPLRTAEMLSPPALLQRPSGPGWLLRGLGLHIPRSRWLTLPIPCFLVEHPQAGPFLVDTGLHASVADDPAENLGRAAKVLYSIDMKPADAAPEQIRARGVDPGSIGLIVMTHLHYDHASVDAVPGRDVPRRAARVGCGEPRRLPPGLPRPAPGPGAELARDRRRR